MLTYLDVIILAMINKHILITVPFATSLHRDIHFKKHGARFGASDAEEYERMADEFMFGDKDRNTRECTRPNRGQRLRFNTWTRYFGSAASVAPEHLKTFYVVEQGHINFHGGEISYFGWECGRINA